MKLIHLETIKGIMQRHHVRTTFDLIRKTFVRLLCSDIKALRSEKIQLEARHCGALDGAELSKQ